MKKLEKSNYKLIDCGKFEKLEQIGNMIFRRPASQCTWQRKLGVDIWEKYNAKYNTKKKSWVFQNKIEMPHFNYNELTFKLKLSLNGQIGIFPEQKTNWLWLQKVISKTDRPLNILNGFTYTGASTLFASSSGISNYPVTITHVDSAASSVNWAKENCRLSSLENNSIRWIVDDIIKFLSREVKRGKKYDGIILDPPAFGKGKKGITWKLNRDLSSLLQLVDQVISSNPEFIILSCHDNKFGTEELSNELKKMHILKTGKIETLDLTINSKQGNDLPSGSCARWRKQ
jgi:23S rRNA (cytosine1962-C5)-methyltransferase